MRRRTRQFLAWLVLVMLAWMPASPATAAPPAAVLLSELEDFRERMRTSDPAFSTPEREHTVALSALADTWDDGATEDTVGDGVELARSEAVVALAESLAPALSPEEAHAAIALAACFASCGDLAAGIEVITGRELAVNRVALHFAAPVPGAPASAEAAFDDGSVLVYTIGAPDDPGSTAVEFERDSYRPRALVWRTPRGLRLRIEATRFAHDGWRIDSLRIVIGHLSRELILVESGRAEP